MHRRISCTNLSWPLSSGALRLYGVLPRNGAITRGGGTQGVHGRSRMTIGPRIPTRPGRSMSGFYQPGRHCLHQAQSAVRYVCVCVCVCVWGGGGSLGSNNSVRKGVPADVDGGGVKQATFLLLFVRFTFAFQLANSFEVLVLPSVAFWTQIGHRFLPFSPAREKQKHERKKKITHMWKQINRLQKVRTT